MKILKNGFKKNKCKHNLFLEVSFFKYEKWLQEKRDNKEVQKQCKKCGLWLFKEEF